MGIVKSGIERHVSILDVTANEALEAMLTNLFFVGISDHPRTAVGRFRSRTRCGNRQRSDEIGPLDR